MKIFYYYYYLFNFKGSTSVFYITRYLFLGKTVIINFMSMSNLLTTNLLKLLLLITCYIYSSIEIINLPKFENATKETQIEGFVSLKEVLNNHSIRLSEMSYIFYQYISLFVQKKKSGI